MMADLVPGLDQRRDRPGKALDGVAWHEEGRGYPSIPEQQPDPLHPDQPELAARQCGGAGRTLGDRQRQGIEVIGQADDVARHARVPPAATLAAVGQGRQAPPRHLDRPRSEEHTSELQSLMRLSYAVFCLKKKTTK